jgi:hypothetical protein
MIRVTNMNSPKGNKVANQFVINEYEGGVLTHSTFQSYQSIIATKEYHTNGERPNIYLDETYWDYSNTTSKYRRDFLGEGVAETRKKIESGEYSLVNLNK